MAFPLIAAQLAIGLAAWGIGKLLEDPARTRSERKTFRTPEVGVGTSLPYVYGNVLVENPVWIWFKNERRQAISATYPNGFRYADMMLSLGIPMSDAGDTWRTNSPPRLTAIVVNGVRKVLVDVDTLTEGITHGRRAFVDIDLSNGGGGWGAGGAFIAMIEFFDGRSDQVIVDDANYIGRAFTLADPSIGLPLLPSAIAGFAAKKPAYRNQMIVAISMSPDVMLPNPPYPSPIYEHGYMGEGTDLFSVQFELEALGTDPILVDGEVYEANPAWALYDILCGRVYKLGLSTSLVDRASFEDASDTLIAEGFGMSSVMASGQVAADLELGICDMINGVIVEDHATGKLKLKLIRDDYDPLNIPVIDKDVLVPSNDQDTGIEIDFYTWDGVVNELSVEFTDRLPDWRTNRATAQRGAVFANNGRLNSKTVKYPWVTSAALAAQLAARELALCSRPLMTAKARVNRMLHAVEIGDAVRMEVDGIATNKAFRVLDADHGQLADGVITLTLIEDVFGQTLGAYPPWGGHPPFELPDPIVDPG